MPRTVHTEIRFHRGGILSINKHRISGAQPGTLQAARVRADHRRLTWIRSGDRWLCVRVDEPDDRLARGALVIAPSFDREAVVSFRTTRALAACAREAGLVAYTFSWSADGDSTGLRPDDDPAQRWVEDLAAVHAHARELLRPDAPVHVVGLRLGAAVLARLPRTGPGRRVYWEPVSGASFLRNHMLIRKASVPVPVRTPGVELDGAMLTPAQVAGLRTLAAPTRAGVDPQDVLRKEPDRRAGLRLALGAPYFAQVPLETVREIVADLPVGHPAPLPDWQPRRTATTTATTPDGRRVQVTETMCEIGPKRLAAIHTQAHEIEGRAAVLFTAMGAEVKAGPGSLWARAARDLAAEGVVSLRADRGEIGDDADPGRAAEPRPYTEAATQDVATAVRALADSGLPVIGVGVCAGAWALLRATGPGYDAPLHEVLGINVVHWHPDPSVYTEAFYAHYHGQEAMLVAAPPAGEEGDEAAVGPTAAGVSLRRRLAQVKESVVTELAIRYPRLRSALRRDVPLDLAEAMLCQVPRRTALTLLYGTQDHRIFVGKGGYRSLRSARRRGLRLHVVDDAGVDHSLFAQRAQQQTIALLRERVADVSGARKRRLGATPAPEPLVQFPRVRVPDSRSGTGAAGAVGARAEVAAAAEVGAIAEVAEVAEVAKVPEVAR